MNVLIESGMAKVELKGMLRWSHAAPIAPQKEWVITLLSLTLDKVKNDLGKMMPFFDGMKPEERERVATVMLASLHRELGFDLDKGGALGATGIANIKTWPIWEKAAEVTDRGLFINSFRFTSDDGQKGSYLDIHQARTLTQALYKRFDKPPMSLSGFDVRVRFSKGHLADQSAYLVAAADKTSLIDLDEAIALMAQKWDNERSRFITPTE